MKNGGEKLRMNPKKFNIIWIGVISFLFVLITAATILMNFFSLSMDIFLGRGEQVVTVPDNVGTWNTEYYKNKYTNEEEMMNAAHEVAVRIAEEGEVLFKNNGVLPLKKGSNVTPFGYRYISPVYGGTGSGAVNTSSPFIVTARSALNEYFSVNLEVENALVQGNAVGMNTTGYVRPNERGGFEGATSQIIEYEPGIYNGYESSCEGTTGLVFVGRIGGEGRDLVANVEGSPNYGTTFFDGTEHHLQLSEYEKAMIRFAKANCENVVVILNTANVMEIADLMAADGDLAVDAILWIGDPGGQGFEAMDRILAGEVNPSGKSVDTWMTDIMSDPVSSNFGNFAYINLWLLTGGFPRPVGNPTEMNLLEYEENIYIGYRYYETVDDTGGSFEVFGEKGRAYEEAVQIPFGFGLSYDADFTQTITAFSDDGDNVAMTVRVTNNGTRVAKDVVQVYYNPPYTDFDIANNIEKATVNLIAFAKTADIAPGAFQNVEVSFAKEDLASYCYSYSNSDGRIGAYVLEEGQYAISINKTAHEEYDSRAFTIRDTIWYDSRNPRQSELKAQSLLDDNGEPQGVPAKAEFDSSAVFLSASNLFQNMTDHMTGTSQLTRAYGSLSNTATTPRMDERIAPDGVATLNDDGSMTFTHIDLSRDSVLGNVPGSKVYTSDMPITGAENGLTLPSLRGLSYYDPLWDKLLDQIDLTDSDLYLALAASYNQTAQIESIGKPTTVDFDGPQGIVGSITDNTEYTAYPCEPIIAATFNRDLAYALGEAVGQEAMFAGVNSWYAPAMNIHRSPFSGRNFEYFSEDPLLSGFMAAREVSGCSDQGLITTIKHYALNDEEMYDNDRSRVSVWANEQAMREIYLKPFEIAIKEATMTINYISDNDGTISTRVMRGATGVMGSMNYLGFTWSGANYALNTALLRDEWGFQGFMITDMVMNAGSNSVDQCLRSGSDTWMAWGDAFTTLIGDTSSPTGVSVIRRSVKNMSYTIVNSRAMNGIAPGTIITYKTAPWIIGLTVANIAVYTFIAAMIAIIILRTRNSKKYPEKYRQKTQKNQTH
jgi:beta-glucosidase